MARVQKLKVFRTSIGFHDAYVAVPSQKAALEAWGSDKNLFASQAAEQVDDPELMREPLANPGKVIKRVRGTMAEHLAALPNDAGSRAKKSRKPPSPSKSRSPNPANEPKGKKSRKVAKPKPRPTRTELDEAEDELAAAISRHEDERAELAKRQAELDRDRQELKQQQKNERQESDRSVERARAKYKVAMGKWQDSLSEDN